MQLYRLTATTRTFLQNLLFFVFFYVTVCARVSYLIDAYTLSSLEPTNHRLHSTDHFTLITLLIPNSTNFIFYYLFIESHSLK